MIGLIEEVNTSPHPAFLNSLIRSEGRTLVFYIFCSSASHRVQMNLIGSIWKWSHRAKIKPIRHLLCVISSALPLIIFTSQHPNSGASAAAAAAAKSSGGCGCNVHVLIRCGGTLGVTVPFVLLWLWQVPADLQNEVLMSLLESDGDVVDYLLRRKASQNLWDPSTFACEAQCIVTSSRSVARVSVS